MHFLVFHEKKSIPSFPFLIMPVASCVQWEERAQSFTRVDNTLTRGDAPAIWRSKECLNLEKVTNSRKSCFRCGRNVPSFYGLHTSILISSKKWKHNFNLAFSSIRKLYSLWNIPTSFISYFLIPFIRRERNNSDKWKKEWVSVPWHSWS